MSTLYSCFTSPNYSYQLTSLLSLQSQVHRLEFPSPLQVYEAVQPLSPKIGLCMDIGHTFRMQEDLIADVKKTRDRLYSMHFKDLDSDRVDAKGLRVGTGVMPIVEVLRELVRERYI